MSPQRTLGRDRLAAGRDSGLVDAAEFETLPARLGYGLLLLFLVAAPWFFSSFWLVNYDYFPQLIFLAGTAFACLLAATSGLKRGPFELLDWLVLAFAGWCTLSVLTSVYQHDSILELARVLGLVTWFFIARVFLLSPGGTNRLPAIVLAIVAGVGIEAALAVQDWVVTRNPRQFGTYITPNLLANALAMGLSFALVLPIIWRRRNPNAPVYLGLLPCLLLAAGLVFTSSKGGYLSALIGLIVTTVAISRARPAGVGAVLRRYWPFMAAGVLLFGFLAFKIIMPRFQTGAGTDYSTLFRVYTWQATWDMALAKPFLGHGIGTFQVAFPQYAIAGYTRHAHQIWLQIAAENGLPAMLLFAAVCALALGRGWRLKTNDWPYTAAALGAVGAFIIHGFSDSGWNVTSIGLMLMVALAILGGTIQPIEIESSVGPRLSYSWVGASLLALGGVMFSMRAFDAEDKISQSEAFLRNSAPTMALRNAEDAVASDPASSRANVQLARALTGSGQTDQALGFYRRAAELLPSRASNWLNLANAEDQLGNPAEAAKNFERAVQVDPNNTNLLLERAQWRLAQKDSRGYDDLKRIIILWDQPYGKYAATPEFVNLDFTRATLLLLPSLQKSGNITEAQRLITKALADVAKARLHEASNRAILAGVGENGPLQLADDLPELEAALKSWQQRLKQAKK